MVKVFVARQPILDREGRIEAYELLFRSGFEEKASISDGMIATAKVVESLISSFGLKRIIMDKKGFINVDERTDILSIADVLPSDRIGFEILETSLLSEDFLKRLTILKDMGYELSLDDFEYFEKFDPYLDLVDNVKIDVLEKSEEEIGELLSKVNRHSVRTVAEKVEDYETYELCLRLGFDLFQGFFFQKPQIVATKTVEPSYAALIKLYNLTASEADVREIENVFRKFSELAVKLIQLINSAYFSLRQPVKSIKHAILMLGYKNMLKWILLLMYSLKEENLGSDPLFEEASIRGFFMEELAKRVTKDKDVVEGAFITGVLSLIDVLLGIPKEKVIPQMALDEIVKRALLEGKGVLGNLLAFVERAQRGNFGGLDQILEDYGLSIGAVIEAQMEALKKFSDLEI